MLGHGRMGPLISGGLAAGFMGLIWLLGSGAVVPGSSGAPDSLAVLADGIQPALVPTLGQWGLLMLALAMMGVAFVVIRRKSTARDRRKP